MVAEEAGVEILRSFRRNLRFRY